MAARMKKKKWKHCHMKLRLEFEEEVEVDLTDVLMKYIILSALETLHGQVGATTPIDIEEFDSRTLEAIIKITEDSLVKIWSALTLFGYYEGKRCRFIVEKVSPTLEEAI